MIPRNDSKTSDWNFRQWLHQMLHTIATQLEHYRPINDSGITLPVGSVVYATDDDKMDQAVSDGMQYQLSQWIGILETETINSQRGTIKNAGYVKVLLDDGLTPVAGDDVFVSLVPGKGTTNIGMLEPTVFIGIVGDASEYVGVPGPTHNPYAYVYLRSLCAIRD